MLSYLYAMRVAVISFFMFMGLIAWMVLPDSESNDRIKGVNLVNPPRPIQSETMAELKRVNAEWVSVIPYAFSRAGEPDITFNHSRQWWGEHSAGNSILIQYAKENGMKVMVKPHVWARGQGWVGDFDLSSEADWKKWESDYTDYILHHAIKADSMGAELFCIGTEYRIPAKNRPAYWRSLIKAVKAVYRGKLTYAANWDNFENISWWDAVDYIGIDAYFPLVHAENPTVEQIEKGWIPVKQRLSVFSEKWKKPILFTEYGFQSANGAAGNHWEIIETPENINENLQANAYEATFRALQNEKWYAGGFFWKWHFTIRNDRWKGTEWTPQGKPAEQVIAHWYSKK